MGLRRLGTESSPDFPLEGTGFELPVPRNSVRAEPISSQAASMHRYMTVRRTRGMDVRKLASTRLC